MVKQTVKVVVKEWLSRSRAYIKFRYSRIFLRLWLWRHPAILQELASQEDYYESLLSGLLPGEHRAFDVGANEGMVTRILLKKGLTVTALDPDPRNARILMGRYSGDPRFHFFPFAAGEGPGEQLLYRQRGATALSTLEPKWKSLVGMPGHRLFTEFEPAAERVKVVTLDNLIAGERVPCLIKIDVEGYERHVLRGLSHRVPLLTFEANLPEFLPETVECLEWLAALDPGARFNYSYAYQYGLAEYIDFASFRRLLPDLGHPCIDVICRMSNYPAFYRV
jgi:FkbM family methyltransferase